MTTKALPSRTAQGAPAFNGEPVSLARYFEDVEELAVSHDRDTDDEKVKLAMRYADTEDEQLWKGVVPVGGITWAAFKTALVTLYPGADGGKRYTANDLGDLVASQVVKCITTTTDFSKYHRTFKKILQHLMEKEKCRNSKGGGCS
jgi:hypothetical protein